MSTTESLRQRLASQDPEFRSLLEAHRAREQRLEELTGRRWLTTDEEDEIKRLKKEKLQLKDRMEAMLKSHA